MSDTLYHLDSYLKKKGSLPLTDADWCEIIRVRQNLLQDMLKYDPLVKLGSLSAFPRIATEREKLLEHVRIKNVMCAGTRVIIGRYSADTHRHAPPNVTFSTRGLYKWVKTCTKVCARLTGDEEFDVNGYVFGVLRDGTLAFLSLQACVVPGGRLHHYDLAELSNDPHDISTILEVRPYRIWLELGYMVHNLVDWRRRRLVDLTSLERTLKHEQREAEFLMQIGQIEMHPRCTLEETIDFPEKGRA